MTGNQALMLVACVACVLTLGVSSDMFSAVVDLENILYAERDLAVEIKNYVEEMTLKLESLKTIADDYESHSQKALQDPGYYILNPVNAFLLIKRFTVDFTDVEDMLKNRDIEDSMDRIDGIKQKFPNYEDLNGAAEALLRLQDVYQLDTPSIARGDLAGLKSTKLTAAECFALGKYAYQKSDYYHTLMWMQEALDQHELEVNKTVDRAIVLDYLAFSSSMQGNLRYALTLTNELIDLVPSHERAIGNKIYYERMLNQQGVVTNERGDTGEAFFENKRPLDDYRAGKEFQQYEAMCRGENLQPYKLKHRLYCKYTHNNHPILILKPAKIEILYFNPWIVAYHDFMNDHEIEVVKRLAMPKLNRATVHNPITGKLETAFYRVSKSAWLRGEDHKIISRMNKRIEAISGLNQDTAEELQVVNYGLGGQYEPHFDFARKTETAFEKYGFGNRIATWINYMSDVEAGGSTVFTYLGVKINPEKGMAGYWYNLYKSGEGIWKTRHAACPVLVGSKWVSNKWIHERGQEFRRPCGLSPDE